MPRIRGSDIQFENGLNILKSALARHTEGIRAQLTDRLALTTANILVKALGQTTFIVMHSVALMHVSLLAGHAIKISPGLSPNEMKKWMIAQAEEAGIDFKKMSRREKRNFNSKAFNASKRALAVPRDRAHIALSLDIEKLVRDGFVEPGVVKEVRIPGFDQSRKWLESPVAEEFHLGVATSLVQMVGLVFALSDLKKSDELSQEELIIKAVASAVGLSATIVETVAATLEKSVTHPLSEFIRSHWAVRAESAATVVRASRVIGAGAGIAVAACDIVFKAPEALEDKNLSLALKYLASGTLGVALSVLMLWGVGIVFWGLLVVAILLGFDIARTRASDLKRWISRCYFSEKENEESEKYSSFSTELQGYKFAIGR